MLRSAIASLVEKSYIMAVVSILKREHSLTLLNILRNTNRKHFAEAAMAFGVFAVIVWVIRKGFKLEKPLMYSF